MAEHLQGFTNDMVHGSLHHLNARNVVAVDHYREVSQTAAQNLAAIVAQESNGAQAALTPQAETQARANQTAASSLRTNSRRTQGRMTLRFSRRIVARLR
jgi:hypothetical protein